MNDRILALLRRVLQTKDPNLSFSKVNEDNVTLVYKILNGKDTLYLKMAEERDEMISPQILAHELLLKRDIRVPRFVSWDDMNATLGRSYMIVKEMPGISLNKLRKTDKAMFDSCVEQVLIEAGRDISKLATISTKGYGFIKRDKKKTKELIGEYDSYKGYLLDKLEKKVSDLKNFGFETFSEDELEKFKMFVYKYIDEEKPILAHGDLDMNHIYVNNGRYSGIIDWGDIRSTGRLYDIALFSAIHPEYQEAILTGFKEFARLGKEFEKELVLLRASICIHRLWWIAKNQNAKFQNHPLQAVLLKDIETIKTF